MLLIWFCVLLCQYTIAYINLLSNYSHGQWRSSKLLITFGNNFFHIIPPIHTHPFNAADQRTPFYMIRVGNNCNKYFHTLNVDLVGYSFGIYLDDIQDISFDSNADWSTIWDSFFLDVFSEYQWNRFCPIIEFSIGKQRKIKKCWLKMDFSLVYSSFHF